MDLKENELENVDLTVYCRKFSCRNGKGQSLTYLYTVLLYMRDYKNEPERMEELIKGD